MTQHTRIARRMANGDPIALEWLERATIQKIKKGPSKGVWIAWSPGKVAALKPDHPDDCGADWWELPDFRTYDGTIAYIELNGW